MTCMRIGKRTVVCVGWPVFLFEGYLFEVHQYFGPMPLNKRTHEPRSTVPAGFWKMWSRFEKLNAVERAECTAFL